MSVKRLARVAMAVGVLVSGVTLAARPAQAGPDLYAGQTLGPGGTLWSSNGFAAIMQHDGNFVVYAPGSRPIWSTRTNVPGSVVVMQNDGNLVVYAPGSRPVWQAGNGGRGPARLVMQTDGNLVTYGASGATWSSYGGRIAPAPPAPPAPQVVGRNCSSGWIGWAEFTDYGDRVKMRMRPTYGAWAAMGLGATTSQMWDAYFACVGWDDGFSRLTQRQWDSLWLQHRCHEYLGVIGRLKSGDTFDYESWNPFRGDLRGALAAGCN